VDLRGGREKPREEGVRLGERLSRERSGEERRGKRNNCRLTRLPKTGSAGPNTGSAGFFAATSKKACKKPTAHTAAQTDTTAQMADRARKATELVLRPTEPVFTREPIEWPAEPVFSTRFQPKPISPKYTSMIFILTILNILNKKKEDSK
jgi:hypothetical protein